MHICCMQLCEMDLNVLAVYVMLKQTSVRYLKKMDK